MSERDGVDLSAKKSAGKLLNATCQFIIWLNALCELHTHLLSDTLRLLSSEFKLFMILFQLLFSQLKKSTHQYLHTLINLIFRILLDLINNKLQIKYFKVVTLVRKFRFQFPYCWYVLWFCTFCSLVALVLFYICEFFLCGLLT